MNFTRKLTIAALSLSMLFSAVPAFTAPKADKKSEETSSSWIPGKKTLAALTVGLGFVAYKYNDAFAGYVDTVCAKANDLSGNRLSDGIAYCTAYSKAKTNAFGEYLASTRGGQLATYAANKTAAFCADASDSVTAATATVRTYLPSF